ncbi:MAG TPA: peroxiredoxin, partial [Schnuerera sp.]|nr:peroxiredoxin [Schnuerera sp.]
MPKEFKAGCQRPVIEKDVMKEENIEKKEIIKEEDNMIKVGKPAPDFTIPAFHEGKFVNLSLS